MLRCSLKFNPQSVIRYQQFALWVNMSNNTSYIVAPGWGSTEMRHQVPIRARVIGVSNIPKPNYIFTHYYEFFDFKTDFKERKPFEVSARP